jgi:putative methyltransferase (TIGR04325 family)
MVRQFRNKNVFTGDYATWAEANLHASGYDADVIFQRVREAALKVKRGEAVYERDSVCFYEEDYRWPALTCLLAVGAERGGNLNVLDFGGALGSFYFQHKKFLTGLKSIRWSVIEQAHVVECGRREFQNKELRFYSKLDDYIGSERADVIFLSSVLQYLESPHSTLAKLAETKAPYILIDRTPFTAGDQDRLTIQHVPNDIFPATLPAYIFSEKNIDITMAKAHYSQKARFPCNEKLQDDVTFTGILYCREAV